MICVFLNIDISFSTYRYLFFQISIVVFLNIDSECNIDLSVCLPACLSAFEPGFKPALNNQSKCISNLDEFTQNTEIILQASRDVLFPENKGPCQERRGTHPSLHPKIHTFIYRILSICRQGLNEKVFKLFPSKH